jgi:glutathione peroxidase
MPLFGKAAFLIALVSAVGVGVWFPKTWASGQTPVMLPNTIYDVSVKNADGESLFLKQYQGKVLLIVNVASKCGFTPQYEGLEALYREFKDQGLVILGFPSNNFMGQEPGTNEDIQSFCQTTYGVTFPVLAKVSVSGKDSHPLFQYLTAAPGKPELAGRVTWNFNKFLVGSDGQLINRFGSKVKPDDSTLRSAIVDALHVAK